MNRDDLAARLLATFGEELEDQVRLGNTHLLALERAPADAEHLRALFRVMHTLKGAARAAGVSSVEQLCHRLETRLALLRDEGRAASADDVAALFAGLDELGQSTKALRPGLRNTPLAVAAISAAAPAAPTVQDAPEATVRIAPERLESLLSNSTRLLIASAESADQRSVLSDVVTLASTAASVAKRLQRAARQSGTEGVDQTVAELTVIDDTLAEIRSRASRLHSDFTETTRRVNRLARELSSGVRDLRLRPFADAVTGLPRVVRDVSLRTGKQVRLQIDGDTVQADRSVLDEIQNALLHLVGNAIDHGIEAPATRRAQGKPEEGVVRVAASLLGDRLIVTVSDDGGGLDVAQLRRALAARGEIVPDDDAAVARRLFSGGITTRASAGAISGRAVGLDAVRASLEAVRGGASVRWTANVGAVFTIEAPLNIASVRGILVRLGSAAIAIPTAYVGRLTRIRVADLRVVDGRAAIVTGGEPVPLVALAALLGPPLVSRPLDDHEIAIAVTLTVADRTLAVRVDELISEEEFIVRPIRSLGPTTVPYVSGAALLPNGTVALVLNAAELVAAGLATPGDAAPASSDRGAKATRRYRVLVADDSITTRTLESSVLEAAGYQVMTAVDGADAWRLLQERGADLVVSDVEMPRMDGVELCTAMRKSSRFKTTPLILVTALETATDRARGLEAGADAYLGKSSFDQESLLETVLQLIGAA